MSELIKEAFRQLYPEKEIIYNFSLKYSRRFNSYNANVKLYGNNLIFNLSKEWKKISKEIQIGLVQELLIKILKNKKNKTMSMELYNLFMKNIHLAVPKTKTDIILEESFDRVNDAYFNGMLDKCNLQWGNEAVSKLGSYEYGNDTITISAIFKNENPEFLDYVMYHEMLHKKFKFQNKNGRNLHHSSEFKRMEAKFQNRDLIEKEISKLARKHKVGIRAILSF
ncbi:SprT-like domain-containing protein [Candidatus Woesearchaeota archaeon]|nr:SprT-like domain-containing protein [Candidatus Woesearchaeota archaeon]